MREELERVGSEERCRVEGTFVRVGSKGGRTRLTALFQDIRLAGKKKVLTDHVWLNLTDGLKSLGELEPGDVVSFDARVREYKKGYWGSDPKKAAKRPASSIDYKLSHPTKFEKDGKKRPVREVAGRWEAKRARSARRQSASFK